MSKLVSTVSLDDMQLFVCVVQAGSLSHAADATGIPVSRLSRRMTELEHALGTQLISRGKKGVALNEVGQRFFERAQRMLQEAQLAIAGVQNSLEKPSGLLRISVAFDVYHFVLAEHLPSYLTAYPDVRLDIELAAKKVNMLQSGIDIALRVGTLENENVVAKTVLQQQFGIFAHADYLQAHGTPQHPSDLYHHSIISQALTLPWRLSKQPHTLEVAPPARVACQDFFSVEKLLQQGMGLGLLPQLISARSGGLVQVLGDWQLPSVSVSAIYYKNRGAVPAVRSFVDWLVAQCRPLQAAAPQPSPAD